jgi:hypothetical protein
LVQAISPRPFDGLVQLHGAHIGPPAVAVGVPAAHAVPVPPSTIGFFSNGGAQAGFIQGVRSGGPGAVG